MQTRHDADDDIRSFQSSRTTVVSHKKKFKMWTYDIGNYVKRRNKRKYNICVYSSQAVHLIHKRILSFFSSCEHMERIVLFLLSKFLSKNMGNKQYSLIYRYKRKRITFSVRKESIRQTFELIC